LELISLLIRDFFPILNGFDLQYARYDLEVIPALSGGKHLPSANLPLLKEVCDELRNELLPLDTVLVDLLVDIFVAVKGFWVKVGVAVLLFGFPLEIRIDELGSMRGFPSLEEV
jgi:hypothetical protein